ncbi:MAG: hypothetical protein WBI07_15155 [Mobilitalea sp.]
MEQDYDKYKKLLPALAAMIKEVENSDGQNINVQLFLKKYQRDYGMGYNALLLYMAVLKRYFKDSLSFVRDLNAIGTITINSMDVLKKIAMENVYSACIMRYEPISQYEQDMVWKIASIFGGNNNSTLDDLQLLLKKWYSDLNAINKVPAIYNDEESRRFIELCNKLDSASIRELCLYELKEAFGHDRDTLIIDNLVDELADNCKKQKDILENGYAAVRKEILLGISDLFGEETDDISKISSMITDWASSLDEAQKDMLNPLQNDESKPLVKMISNDAGFADTLLVQVPSDMKFGSVKSWLSNKSKEYLSAFAKGKKHIEEEVFSVAVPKFEVQGKDIEQEERDSRRTDIRFSGEMSITFKMGEDNLCYFVTTDGTDPNKVDVQREKRIEAYTLRINEDSTVKVCGMSQDSKYSSVITLSCVNEDTKYEIKSQGFHQYLKVDSTGFRDNNEIKVSTILPIDSDSLSLCVKSIVNKMQQDHNVSKTDVIIGLKKVISELEG